MLLEDFSVDCSACFFPGVHHLMDHLRGSFDLYCQGGIRCFSKDLAGLPQSIKLESYFKPQNSYPIAQDYNTHKFQAPPKPKEVSCR